MESGYSPWQKSFHDHVIRDEVGFAKIAKYIDENINNWEVDCFHPHNRV